MNGFDDDSDEFDPETGEIIDAEAPTEEADDATVTFVYANVAEFVEQYFRYAAARQLSGRKGDPKWSSRWWESPAALWRLKALWLAFEELMADGGTAPSNWFLHHLDPHAQVLFSQDGPFAGVDDLAVVAPGDPLPCDPVPPGLNLNDLFEELPAH